MVAFLFPIAWHYWYWKCAWAVSLGLVALFFAHRKNRSLAGWAGLSGLFGLLVGSPALAVLVLLGTRKKLSMRMKYLTLKFEEDLADALRLPSPVGDDIEKRVLMVLANNPKGLRLGALAQGMGLDWRHIEEVVEKLRVRGKVRKEAERYFFNLD